MIRRIRYAYIFLATAYIISFYQGISVNDDGPVPVVQNRPSSRGGMAFDITYDQPANSRLDKIKTRTSKKAKPELTMADLQTKLEAAENRRKVCTL